MIKIISQDKEKQKISFTADMSETMANAIRRSVLEIPTLAIEEVEFFKNDSALYDEFLAHRMGLIPLVTEKTLVEKDKCTCKGKGCSKCSVEFSLKMKGPSTVYSGNLKGKGKVVHDKFPIVILAKDQELELVARANLGRGSMHSKFSPGLVFYRHVAKIEVNKECDDCKECLEACPQKILSIEKGKLNVSDIYKCDLCEACVEECKKHGKDAIKVGKDENLIFFIESWGQLPVRDIFVKAVSCLNEDLKSLSKQIK